jgi:hypothetical protein
MVDKPVLSAQGFRHANKVFLESFLFTAGDKVQTMDDPPFFICLIFWGRFSALLRNTHIVIKPMMQPNLKKHASRQVG